MANGNWQGLDTKRQRFWRVHIRAWTKSGLSQNEYCRRNQLKNNQFGYWKKKMAEQSGPAVSFIPVPVDKPLPASAGGKSSGLTVVLRNGIAIQLDNDFTAAALSQVVALLGEGS